jgi:hypothetical protein
MPTLKQYFDRNERLYSAIIPDRGVFAPEPFKGGRAESKARVASSATAAVRGFASASKCGVEGQMGWLFSRLADLDY